MTAAAAAPSAAEALTPAAQRLAQEARDYAATRLDSWRRQVRGAEQPTGPLDAALVGGALAWAKGHNPLAGGLRAAWRGADATGRMKLVATVLAIVVLAPVAALLLLVAGLVVAALLKARGTT